MEALRSVSLDLAAVGLAAPAPADVVLVATTARLAGVELSSGSRLAWEGGQDPPGCYVYEARIPREPWAWVEDAAFHVAADAVEPSTTIAVLPRSDALVSFARESGIGVIDSFESCRGFNSSGAHAAVLREVRSAFAPYFSSASDTESLGLRVGEPESSTTTWDYSVRAQPGLHVDNWDLLSLEQRAGARNRLCVNLGSERRYLLFLPLSIQRMLTALGSAGSRMSHAELVLRFLDRFPELPVCRIPVLPGEAYVAPTENVVHDGSTLDSSSVDVSFSVLGRFRLRAGRV